MRFTFGEEDLNFEGRILFPCAAEFLDVTDFCELDENLFIVRDVIPEFLRPELGVRIEVVFTWERERLGFPEE